MKETKNTPKYIRDEFDDTRIDANLDDDFSFNDDGGDF